MSPFPGAPWHLPVKLLLVGDSQANMLDLNAPSTVTKSFQLVDGWVEGGALLGRIDQQHRLPAEPGYGLPRLGGSLVNGSETSHAPLAAGHPRRMGRTST